MNKYNVEFIEKIEKPTLLEWKELWNESEFSHYFNSPEWFMTCRAVFPSKKYFIVIVRNDKELMAILPIELKSKFGITYMQNPGDKYVDRSALLVRDANGEVLEELFGQLCAFGSFSLTEMPQELADKITDQRMNVLSSSVNLYLPFEGDPLRLVKEKHRKRIERLIKKNSKYLEFKLYRGSKRALRTAMTIDSRSYREKKKIGTFRNEIDRAFFTKLIEKNGQNVGINILYFRKKPIAYEIGVQSNNTYYGLNRSFDCSYRNISAGNICEYLLITSLYKVGIAGIDFCRGEDLSKRNLTSLERKQYEILYVDSPLKRSVVYFVRMIRALIANNIVLYKVYRRVVYLLF